MWADTRTLWRSFVHEHAGVFGRVCVFICAGILYIVYVTPHACVMRVEAEVHLCVWGGLMDGFGASVGLCGIKLGGCACKISTHPVIIGRGANIRKRKEKKPLKKLISRLDSDL